MSGKQRVKLVVLYTTISANLQEKIMAIGKKIKELRLQKGMTQEDLAAKTDLSIRTIQRIENEEVDPRSYTLNLIAKALEVGIDVFNEKEEILQERIKNSENQKWVALLHLNGLFCLLLPPILIWIWKKDQVEGINKHAIQVINFQISMWVYLFSSVLLLIIIIGLPLLIFLGLWNILIITINSVKVIKYQDVRYPFSLNIIKSL